MACRSALISSIKPAHPPVLMPLFFVFPFIKIEQNQNQFSPVFTRDIQDVSEYLNFEYSGAWSSLSLLCLLPETQRPHGYWLLCFYQQLRTIPELQTCIPGWLLSSHVNMATSEMIHFLWEELKWHILRKECTEKCNVSYFWEVLEKKRNSKDCGIIDSHWKHQYGREKTVKIWGQLLINLRWC